MAGRRGARVALVAVLAAYAALFIALSVDVMVRVWDWRWKFESAFDVGTLLFFEGIRSVVTAAGIAAALFAATRSRRHAALSYLALATAFATVLYTKAIAFRGFPGAVQESLAGLLLDAGVPRWLLQVVFGQPAWAGWLALGALLLFARGYPRAITGVDVRTSGAADRAGALRSVAVAGTDVGSIARRGTAWLLDNAWLDARRVAGVTLALAAVHTAALLTRMAAVQALGSVLAVAAAAVLVGATATLLRVGWLMEHSGGGTLLIRLRRGAMMALVLLAASAAAAVFGWTAIAVMLLSLAPAAIVAGVLAATAAAPANANAAQRPPRAVG